MTKPLYGNEILSITLNLKRGAIYDKGYGTYSVTIIDDGQLSQYRCFSDYVSAREFIDLFFPRAADVELDYNGDELEVDVISDNEES